VKRWLVRITPGDRGVVHEAERMATKFGVLKFWSTEKWESDDDLVIAYGVGAWHSVQPAPQEDVDA